MLVVRLTCGDSTRFIRTYVGHDVGQGDEADEAEGGERGVGRLDVGLVVEHVVGDERVDAAVAGVEEELQRQVGAVVGRWRVEPRCSGGVGVGG